MSSPFIQVAKSVHNREVAVPQIRLALYDPDFEGFTVDVEGWENREPDGYFHPSTHPLWPERMLYYYIAEPQKMVEEPFEPTGTLAVTAGSFFHTFVQHVGVRAGFLVRIENCACGCTTDVEEYHEDPLVKSRGHSDGIFFDGNGFEFKTMNPAKMRGIPRGEPDSVEVLEWFKTKCPDYYAQQQDYMRMGGRRRVYVVIVEMTYPFTMREIWVDYDPFYANQIREKYARVLKAVEHGQEPHPCCAPRSKEAASCPARLTCPIGMM